MHRALACEFDEGRDLRRMGARGRSRRLVRGRMTELRAAQALEGTVPLLRARLTPGHRSSTNNGVVTDTASPAGIRAALNGLGSPLAPEPIRS